MKNITKLLFASTLGLFITTTLSAQKKYPKEGIIAKEKAFLEQIHKIDSLTALVDPVIMEESADSTATTVAKPEPSNKTIIRTVYEGSKNLNETRTLKHAGVEKVVVIGAGNFQNILYVDKLTNQVIKIKHINTMEFMYDVGEDEKANTERVELDLYYDNEKLFYAVYNEDHYKSPEELLFSNKYQLQMTSYHKDIYFMNEFQKTIYKYVQDTSDTVLKQK